MIKCWTIWACTCMYRCSRTAFHYAYMLCQIYQENQRDMLMKEFSRWDVVVMHPIVIVELVYR